jgi:hypothetical protein
VIADVADARDANEIEVEHGVICRVRAKPRNWSAESTRIEAPAR